ncbi:Di-copper centre-containing protein [Neolentinus lepideus HHB14362 ss-1]|uniref:Di-copper centre-containing protein n=1 Tax=Neolentinus lepideus HHB14362 ss-1 TaxID=1314782 RepID=A0A165V412_9AGAM|nr:Di-copper centre-containing protein [Neolentinus lepideus HHB14362 ss-1]
MFEIANITVLLLALLSLTFARADETAEVVLADVESGSTSTPCTATSVRKEWRTLSRDERADFIRAANCLARLPHTPDLEPTVFPSDIPPVNKSGSYYDDFIYIHMDLNMKIHYTGHFFPWHRWYINTYEMILRDKCGFQGLLPYWNWSMDATDFEGSDFWKDPDPVSGLGGWGDPHDDYAVKDGGLAGFPLSYPSPHILRRNFTLMPYLNSPWPWSTDPHFYGNNSFTIEEVSKMINGFTGDYIGLQTCLAKFQGSHNSLHFIVGGDLGGTCPWDAPSDCVPGPTFSVNDPIFFFHHAMVDKIWHDWQNRDLANFWQFGGGSVSVLEDWPQFQKYPTGAPPMMDLNTKIMTDGMFPEITVRDVMNTTGGYLCYVYQ